MQVAPDALPGKGWGPNAFPVGSVTHPTAFSQQQDPNPHWDQDAEPLESWLM